LKKPLKQEATMSNIVIHSLADEALDAFWQVLVRKFPQASSGDLSIGQAIDLRTAAENAIEEWIASNVRPEANDRHVSEATRPSVMEIGCRFKLVRPVDRFPDFLTPAGLTGTVTVTEGGVWAKMHQPMPGADAWDNELYWDTAEEFLLDTEALA
jgi:hypothetical protein